MGRGPRGCEPGSLPPRAAPLRSREGSLGAGCSLCPHPQPAEPGAQAFLSPSRGVPKLHPMPEGSSETRSEGFRFSLRGRWHRARAPPARALPLRCAAPGRGAPAWSGTGAGQEGDRSGTGAGHAAKGPPPPPPAPLILLKVSAHPASIRDGVKAIALSGGKKIIFTETKTFCRGGDSDSKKVVSILSAVGNSATTRVYCCNPARQISAFVCNSRDNAVLLGHCFEPG